MSTGNTLAAIELIKVYKARWRHSLRKPLTARENARKLFIRVALLRRVAFYELVEGFAKGFGEPVLLLLVARGRRLLVGPLQDAEFAV